MQLVGLRHDAAVLDLTVRAEQAQPRLVHVERPRTDGVTTGQRHHGPLAPRDQRPEHTHRGAELASPPGSPRGTSARRAW